MTHPPPNLEVVLSSSLRRHVNALASLVQAVVTGPLAPAEARDLAALFARLNQALGRPLGFANPLLYRPAAEATFHGIVSGSNGGYSAGPGWNPCTGWGSPDGTTLLAALRASLSLP